MNESSAALLWVKALALSALAVFAPVQAMILASLALVILDSVTGIMAARKRGERITSAGLRRTLSKGLVFTLALLTAHLAGHYLLANQVPVVSLVAGCIGLVEGKSVMENLSTIAGRDVLASAINALGSKNDRPPG